METGFIDFTEDFVRFVGTELPYGVSAYRPAFIEVIESVGEWLVTARYYATPEVYEVLWITKERPQWSIPFKGRKNG